MQKQNRPAMPENLVVDHLLIDDHDTHVWCPSVG